MSRLSGSVLFASLLAITGSAPGTGSIGFAAEKGFPYEQELLLDARPMKGSKHVPSLDIAENGLAEIELWCGSVKGQMVVAGDTITILTGEKTERSCTPERMRGDEEVLSALTEATTWRREGDILVLMGARTLRFRLPTN